MKRLFERHAFKFCNRQHNTLTYKILKVKITESPLPSQHYLFHLRSVRRVEIDLVKAYLTANPVFKERERERDGLHTAHSDDASKCMFACRGQKKTFCYRSTRKKIQKFSQELFHVNGFLPFPGDTLTPVVSVNFRGSEDGAENIPPAPPFRPINCISPKQRGNFSSMYFFCILFAFDRL